MLTSINDLWKRQDEIQGILNRVASISRDWDDFIEEDEGGARERRPGIHASELSCGRKVVYTLLDSPKNNRFAKKWKQRFKMGHAIHAMIQKDFLRLAATSHGRVQFVDEVKVAPEYQEIAKLLRLDSSCDGIFTFYDDPNGPPVARIGLEIKSSSPDEYEKLKEPKPEHVKQAHLYMKALDLPLMWFLYFNKGNQNNTPSLAPWLISYNDSKWQEIEAECRTYLQAAEDYPKTFVLPERNEGILCEFCPYAATVCKPDYLAKKEAMKFKPIRRP